MMKETDPIELYCPECGYKAFFNEASDNLTRDQVVTMYRIGQNGDDPKCCPGCSEKGKKIPFEIH